MTIIWYTHSFYTPKISTFFSFFQIYQNICWQASIHTTQKAESHGLVWCFCFFWVNTLPVWHQWRFDPGHCGRRLLHSAGPTSMSRLQGMQSCPCKAAGKLSHINNKIQSSPCFFFFLCLQGWPALGRMTHVHTPTELSSALLPGSPCIDLSSRKKEKNR